MKRRPKDYIDGPSLWLPNQKSLQVLLPQIKGGLFEGAIILDVYEQGVGKLIIFMDVICVSSLFQKDLFLNKTKYSLCYASSILLCILKENFPPLTPTPE